MITKLLLTIAALVLLLTGCSAEGDGTTGPSDTSANAREGTAAGTVSVRLETVQGIFTEGFEVGLRFEDGDGKVIDATLWSAFVESQVEPAARDYYGSVYELTVPAGRVAVLASANIGIGPGPEIPDIEGNLRCRLDLDIGEGEHVAVEVAFTGNSDCLSLVGLQLHPLRPCLRV